MMSSRKGIKTTNPLIQQKAVQAVNRGAKLSEVAKQYDLNLKTLSTMYKKYKESGQTQAKQRGHRQQTLTSDMKDQLCDWVDEDVGIKLKDLAVKLMEKYGKSASTATISKALKEFHYSIKRVSLVPERRNTQDVIEKRCEFANWYLTVMHQREKIFYLDETGIQVFSRRNYGRSQKGTRANRSVTAIRSRNHSISAAMCSSSLYFFEVQDRPYSADHYNDFLVKFLDFLDRNEISGAILIMDNVPFHKGQQIRGLVRARGHDIVFSPPYSPFLNPIEGLFGQWKVIIKEFASKNEGQLYQNV